MKKRIIRGILLLSWCLLIFFLSLENGEESSSRSKKVVNDIIAISDKITNSETKEEKKEVIINNTNFYVRKLAHFSEYLVLALLTYLFLKEYNLSKKKIFIFTLLFCFLFASSDEIHQMFSDGRSPRVLDVFIDTSGSFMFLIINYLINKFRGRVNLNGRDKLKGIT